MEEASRYDRFLQLKIDPFARGLGHALSQNEAWENIKRWVIDVQ
jgi:hypothetical protein